MKITLPNGVVIEGDDVTGEFVAGLVANLPSNNKKEVEPDLPKEQDSYHMAAKFADIEARLTGSRRDTLRVIRKYKMGVSLSTLADELDITNAAASQRARDLVDDGLVMRIAKGQYQAL